MKIITNEKKNILCTIKLHESQDLGHPLWDYYNVEMLQMVNHNSSNWIMVEHITMKHQPKYHQISLIFRYHKKLPNKNLTKVK